MYKLSKILSEIKSQPTVTPDMVKDLYDNIMNRPVSDKALIAAGEMDIILSKYGIKDFYRYDVFLQFDKMDPKQLIEIYTKFLSLKKDLEK